MALHSVIVGPDSRCERWLHLRSVTLFPLWVRSVGWLNVGFVGSLPDSHHHTGYGLPAYITVLIQLD